MLTWLPPSFESRMEPTNHVLVALLPVVAYSALRYRRLPSGSIVLVAVFAGLFADLVDKPLAWTFGIIPSGRMVAHSIVVSIPLVITVLLIAYRTDRLPHGVVFSWGHLSHIAGDFYPVVSRGADYYYYPNMFWPLMEANPSRSSGFSEHIPAFSVGTAVEVTILLIILGYIVLDLRRRWDIAGV